MKSCKKCGLCKPLGEFYIHRQMADGHLNNCKACVKASVKENSDRVGKSYDRTEKGVIRVIYKTQKRHSKLRGHGELPYTKKELASWMYDSGFKNLYDSWVDSGYRKDKKPSVDRKDDFKGYSFDNIQLGTWLDNRNHQKKDILNGTGTSGLRCKSLKKIDSGGGVVCIYVSYSSAVRDVGYSLEYQIKTGAKCRNGFYWEYA